jgi:ArsR family transcriptional regulator
MAKNTKRLDAERLFRAFADPTRLRLLNLLDTDEVCVCFLVEALEMSQPKISRHLAYLRRAGIVSARREGKWMHYRLKQPVDSYLAAIFSALHGWLKNNPQMQMDRSRLVKLCCSPKAPSHLRRAPKPLTTSLQITQS